MGPGKQLKGLKRERFSLEIKCKWAIKTPSQFLLSFFPKSGMFPPLPSTFTPTSSHFNCSKMKMCTFPTYFTYNNIIITLVEAEERNQRESVISILIMMIGMVAWFKLLELLKETFLRKGGNRTSFQYKVVVDVILLRIWLKGESEQQSRYDYQNGCKLCRFQILSENHGWTRWIKFYLCY